MTLCLISIEREPRSWPRRLTALTSFAAVLLQLHGCSALTDVTAPDVVQPTDLESAAGAAVLWSGSVSIFYDAFARTVVPTGEMSDELSSTLNFGNDTDRLTLVEGGLISQYPYSDHHRVRINTFQAIDALKRFAPQPASRVGQLYAVLGFSELFFGEHLCSGIPLSSIENLTPVYGLPLTSSEMLARAVADLDTAIFFAADSSRILNLARVGRGRALVDLGRFSEAAAAVAAVPTSYVYRSEHSATAQPNRVFDAINTAKTSTVTDREGINGLNFRTANDPRLGTQLVGKGSDRTTDVYAFTLYASSASPIVLASGTEARLIEAEAALNAGDAARALAILNALRAATPGLAPLSPETTEAARVDQLFRERAFWLFLTGHRQGDLRRLVRQYGRAQQSVFPTGPYRAGLTYGNAVTFTPSTSQLENPNYHGCLDRNP
jgi:hypothetical protein